MNRTAISPHIVSNHEARWAAKPVTCSLLNTMKHLSSILLVLTAVTVLAVEQSSSITIRGWQFDFPAFLKQEATARPDFTVTYFTSTERKITVGIYEGMHPQQFADK